MKVSEGDINLPNNWYTNIEKSKEKARKLLKKIVALDMKDSIVTGVVEDVMLDRFFKLKYPFCKITLKNVKKYNVNEKLESKLEEQIFFVNNPKMILDLKEMSSRFPNIYEDVNVEIKRGAA